MLKITKICGNDSIESYLHEVDEFDLSVFTAIGNTPPNLTIAIEARGLRLKNEKQVAELEFVKQLWSKINKNLFNFIDAVILIDVLIMLFTLSKSKGVPELSEYLSVAAHDTVDSPSEVQTNIKRNSK